MEISVTVRQNKKHESKIAAHADVTLEFSDGRIQLNSFCVFKPDGKAAWIAPPATKGEKRFFPLVALSGEIRKRVEAAILSACDLQQPAVAPAKREPGEDV